MGALFQPTALPRPPVAALHMCAATYHDGPFAVAPMMDYTNQFLRYLLRRITRRATLYTEMVTANSARLALTARSALFSQHAPPACVEQRSCTAARRSCRCARRRRGC